MTTDNAAGNKPVHEISDGPLRVSIWMNQNERGPWYTATCRRSYKDGDQWKETQSYGEDNLLRVAKLFDLAHTWILERKSADAQARRQETSAA